MNRYYYCVNTFKSDTPVQLEGFVKADSEEAVIGKLIQEGVIDPRSYEFLDLYEERG
jgi:hypothetical protein